jgi:hypothetical protein
VSVRNDWIVAGLAVLAVLSVSGAVDGQNPAAGGAWLEHSPPTNWNVPGASVPKAATPQGEPSNRERCKASLRRSTMPEDRGVVQAGWLLVGAYQHFSGTAVVTGTSDFDGMCRPVGYQVFVFADRVFAGTLAPGVMTSRTDGAESRVHLFRADELSAEFLRYAESDPLCCASRLSRVIYRVERRGKTPVLVPVSASTEALPNR